MAKKPAENKPPAKRAKKAGRKDGYAAYRERKAKEARAQSLSGRDIGELPAVRNPERREKASKSLAFFCETYFPRTFNLEWSDDHRRVIGKIEEAVLSGGLFAMAMPRGSGKTSLCEIGCLWALAFGHREYVALIGSDATSAVEMLDSIKAELENNELLLEDFPEICFPIRALEGITQRSAGQLHKGKQTHIRWTEDEIVLPTIEGAAASGAIIRVAGITGRIRGMKFKRTDGKSARPDLVLIDDPQTDESARSPSQCEARGRILSGAILGLAGPGRRIAGLAAVTVIQEGDLADQLLDRDRHPQWQGERTKMVYAFPTDEKLWDEYARIRGDGLRDGTGTAAATVFYKRNRTAMDEGAIVAWPARKEPGELSALQHAMNLKLDRGERAFFAEYQNEPLPETPPDNELLSADAVAAKVSGIDRGIVPATATHLTAFIDVQAKCLFWVVCAWEDTFTGYIVDYGTEPDQRSPYFTLRDSKHTLARAHPRAGLEGQIYAGLDQLVQRVVARDWRRDGGGVARIDRCLIDANWGKSTEVVYQFCRQSAMASVMIPSHGRGITAANLPLNEYSFKRGDRVGLNWRVPVPTKRAVRHVVYDTNFWKSFMHARLATTMGDPGCLSLFGRKAEVHRLLSEHLTAEYRIETHGRGRVVDQWDLRADNLDNHWLDGVVGCLVAASMCGVQLGGVGAPRRERKRVSLREMQKRKQVERGR